MTDSFFDFSNMSNADRTFEEDDDTEYDALNNETFGEDIPGSDWEEVHEQLASKLEQRSFDDENDELCERVASSILEDEIDDVSNPTGSITQPTRQPTQKQSPAAPVPLEWWTNGVPQTQDMGKHPKQAQGPSNPEPWWQRPQAPYAVVQAMQMPPKPPKILTVEELEESMRKEAVAVNRQGPARGPSCGTTNIPEEHMPSHTQNGNYGHGRAIMGRGRYRSEVNSEQPPYHAVHHPYPPYPGGPSMVRPPFRHQGPMFPRYYDGRMGPHQAGAVRHPRPGHQMYFANQHKAFGRGGPPQRVDEYAGLMSPMEKQWLASIQMIPLNTSQPFQDDYYNLMYQQRQGCSGRKICGTQSQKREQLSQKPASAYTPLQFENSLGKLQAGSVTAPRKIIEMELVDLDYNSKQTDKKTKQILLEIEEMFSCVIKMEDSFNPLNTMKQDIDIPALQRKLLSMVMPEGKLVQIMAIRKGKMVILRILPQLTSPAVLLDRLMLDLVSITRKDSESNMLLFLPTIRNYLQGLSLATLVEITNNYDNQFLLSNKFTVSMMANLIERADQVRAECTDEGILNEWDLFLIRLIESTRYWNHTERPVVALDRNLLIQHISHLMDQVTQAEVNSLLNTLQSAAYSTPTSQPSKGASSEDTKI